MKLLFCDIGWFESKFIFCLWVGVLSLEEKVSLKVLFMIYPFTSYILISITRLLLFPNISSTYRLIFRAKPLKITFIMLVLIFYVNLLRMWLYYLTASATNYESFIRSSASSSLYSNYITELIDSAFSAFLVLFSLHKTAARRLGDC
jgi:hypothetical protein